MKNFLDLLEGTENPGYKVLLVILNRLTINLSNVDMASVTSTNDQVTVIAEALRRSLAPRGMADEAAEYVDEYVLRLIDFDSVGYTESIDMLRTSAEALRKWARTRFPAPARPIRGTSATQITV